jgi:energy-coupling factor transport system ATP-binding protein
MAVALSIQHLNFEYEAGLPVLQDINIEIKQGSYSVILGHNGSGKSTLAKLLIGLLPIQGGEVFVLGTKLEEKSIHEIRNKIGIVFQNPDNQFIGATVEDDIAFGLENHLIPHEQMQGIIDKFAKRVNMEMFLKQEPSNLSGGQKQRVAIAGVLAMSPQIIIFDEATSMLDPKGKNEIKELIAQMRKSNPDMSIISITHDVEEGLLADQVIIVNQGKVFKQGSPEMVFSNQAELRSVQLDVPFAYKLKQLLSDKGLDPKSVDIKEMVKFLCR